METLESGGASAEAADELLDQVLSAEGMENGPVELVVQHRVQAFS